MSLQDLVTAPKPSPFTAEDRIMHTTKVAERTFGVDVAQIGTVETDGDRAVLVLDVGGKRRVLRWQRHQRGQIQWFVDDNEKPLVLAGGNDPLARLYQELGG